MKKQQTGLLLLLSIISLLGIGTVFVSGFLKNNPKNSTNQNTNNSSVLGEKTADVNRVVSDALQYTKDTVSQQTTEIQKTIVNNVEKEVSNLAQSQVDALKLQICRDWGLAK